MDEAFAPRPVSRNNARTTQPVSWTGVVNVTVTGNSVKKTSGCVDCQDAGAISRQQITSGDGYLEFTASETNTRRSIGLSNGNPGTNPNQIRYAIDLRPRGGADIREYGVYQAGTTFVAGDVFRITVEASSVRYYKNGRLFYTSSLAPVYPLLADTSLLSLGATVSNVMISGTLSRGTASPAGTIAPAVTASEQGVVWNNLVSATAGSSFQKHDGCYGCSNASADSLQQSTSGNGYVALTVTGIWTPWSVGLTHGFSYANSRVILCL